MANTSKATKDLSINLIPAYGRAYGTKKAALADFNAGKDFEVCDCSCPGNGRYVTKRELESTGIYGSAKIRYGKNGLTEALCVKI